MNPLILRIYKTLFRSRFWFALLLGLLPLQLLAQFCANGVTVVRSKDGDTGDALDQFGILSRFVLDADGNLYVNDRINYRVLKFAPGSTEGVIVAGGNGEGDALNQFKGAYSILLDGGGNLLVADSHNHRVLMFPPNSTSATSGTIIAGGNGQGAGSNQLEYPDDIAVDKDGYLYVISTDRIKKFPPTSTSATAGTVVAGGNGEGDALNQFKVPSGIFVDADNNLFVCDSQNFRILKFPPNSTSATSGTIVAGGNGMGGASNQFFVPVDIITDGVGNLYVTDDVNNRVQQFPPNSTSLTSGTTIAGSNVGNGPNQLNIVGGLFMDGAGNLYLADVGNYRIQRFSPSSPFSFIGQQPTSQTTCVGATVTAAVSVSGTAGSYQWYKDDVSLDDAQQQATLSLTNIQLSDAGSYYVIVTGCSSLTSIPFTLDVTTPHTPVLSVSPTDGKPIFQNTPYVTLAISGCEGGTVSWQGPGGANGSSTLISVPTSATGTLVYSATCTVGSCVSAPGSATVTVSSPEVSGSFDGFVYGADCATFRGWAWDRNKINTVQSIQILDGPKVIATIPANEFRQDLKDAGKGNGIHAFRWSISAELKDGQVHYLSARIANSSFLLKDSPKALICEGGTTSPPNKQPVAPAMTPLLAQQGVEFITTLPVFTDPEGSTLSYGLVTLPTGLIFTSASRQISGTPTASGLFVLTYSATDDKGATNSVSFPLTVNPASTTNVTGSFEGYLDKVECGTVRGWVWDRNKPNTPVTVEFYGGNTVWGSVVANIYRDDLKNAGKGNGAHAYSFTVPVEMKDGLPRGIRARVSGSTYDLKDSGKSLTCPSPVRLSAETSNELQVTVLGNPVSDQVTVEVRGAEGQSLRFNLTTTAGTTVHAFQIKTAQAIERHTVSVQGQSAGMLLLQVSTPAQNRTLKILKP
jgi:sugar lactone lactonase YvrE